MEKKLSLPPSGSKEIKEKLGKKRKKDNCIIKNIASVIECGVSPCVASGLCNADGCLSGVM
jgi:hypothetical protein